MNRALVPTMRPPSRSVQPREVRRPLAEGMALLRQQRVPRRPSRRPRRGTRPIRRRAGRDALARTPGVAARGGARLVHGGEVRRPGLRKGHGGDVLKVDAAARWLRTTVVPAALPGSPEIRQALGDHLRRSPLCALGGRRRQPRSGGAVWHAGPSLGEGLPRRRGHPHVVAGPSGVVQRGQHVRDAIPAVVQSLAPPDHVILWVARRVEVR
eukprot:CAMPEP_0176016498 /NCGR_PEP_ID=MMETSP0120_2-20121206/7881_1 /TAXON_ID=160619 /ORGANISM="Kryptoperidinium foliaceum, Strain CCMP 1326" /LENGTH=210 /DNA_ID=CAMNT_0017349495 /DNA_START=90 /DNA_END=719 /DNA_ORIENTATION=-